MDSPKGTKTSIIRILLCVGSLLPVANFAWGLGAIGRQWYGYGGWTTRFYLWFRLPYVALMVLFLVSFGLAKNWRLRSSAVLLGIGLCLTSTLFVYDVKHQRAQYSVGTVQEDGSVNYHGYYVFWWWWEKWGTICVH